MQTNRARHWFCAIAASLWMWLLIVYAVIVLAATANAESLKGLDLLGLAKMNAKMISEEIDPGTAIGWLEVTFGPAHPNAKVVLDSGKVTAVRVHLIDGTCIRSSRCPKGAPGYESYGELEKRAKSLGEFMAAYPTVTLYVSPWLEHDERNPKVVTKWFEILKRVLPKAKLVCSNYTGVCVPGVLKEKHGNTGQADIRSNDGASLFDGNTTEFRQSARVLALGWDYSFNGRTSGEKVFAPPLSRRDFADREILRQAVRVMRPATRAADFAGCSVIRKPELGKTNAEYYGKGKDDGRGNKFLFISKNRIGERLRIETLRGKEVGCLKYFGPFSGGGYRYYVGNCSGQSPTRLMDLLGSEWGIIRWKGGCRLFSPIRRTGYFH